MSLLRFIFSVHYNSAHYYSERAMKKNITLSAEDFLIEKARRKAVIEHTTLNQAFRDWLTEYVEEDSGRENFTNMMERLSYARSGGKFSRDELNER